MNRSALVVVVALCGALGGCLHPAAKVAAPTRSAPIFSPRASGTWEWVARTTDEESNVRVEQEEWHLEQRGSALRGYYDRVLTLTSTDDRLFRCNRQLSFTKITRVQVAGTVSGNQVTLQEVGFQARPGPCEDGQRSMVQYTGVVGTATIKLSWGEGGMQTLMRADQAGAALAEGPPPEEVEVGDGPRASVPVAGTWEWEQRSIDADGDERMEHEEWHLTESAESIGGFYERKVTRVRATGDFSCSKAPRFETVTRYTIAGLRRGDKLVLTETKYDVPQPSSCDNGKRRLDSYQGTVSGDGDELVLSWGPGNQLLRRRPRP